MAGTAIGAAKAAKTNIERHGEDFFKTIGSRGGRVTGVKKGFAANRETAVRAGMVGGTRSRRGKSESGIKRDDKIFELWREGVKPTHIAKRLKVDYRTVKRVVDKLEV